MTAEIALMNRNAIALAADSAVTVGDSSNQKIFNTVNKLFMLSKHEPVGVMIYGNAVLAGVPWETIIKVFRRQLGDTTFLTLREYADALVKFLSGNKALFTAAQQQEGVTETARAYLRPMVAKKFEARAEELLQAKSPLPVPLRDFKSAFRAVVRDASADLDKVPFLDGHDASSIQRLMRRYRSQIQDVIDEFFDPSIRTEAVDTSMRRLVCSLLVRDRFPTSRSGVVVAGFGDSEFFPSLVAYDMAGVFADQPKIKENGKSAAIGATSNSASVIPFAQDEMVYLFMEGVDPSYHRAIETELAEFAREMATLLATHMGLAATPQKAMQKAISGAVAKTLKELDNRRDQGHVHAIIRLVSLLPKEELAEMAESLVNLTSFKRRVTMDPETVGGPVDVAVISKGDGFVWIKRKHYFDAKLNHQFFSNYYQ